MNITLGPVQYYWDRTSINQFYAHWLNSPLSSIYLGEVVCGKRHQLKPADWIELARELAGSCDKEIILSTLTLLESNADLNSVRKLCDNEGLKVEANDVSAIQFLSEKKLPFVAGPAINIYNAQCLSYLMGLGLQRWVVPVELSQQQLSAILQQCQRSPEVEVLAWGRLPLAYSARCFTARHHKINKDQCQYLCQQYPAGLQLRSQESQQLFTLNGIATLSGEPVNLLNDLHTLAQTGVTHLRISPEWEQTDTVVNHLHQALQAGKGSAGLTGGTDGYWRGQPGMDLIARTG